jgi:hypothetical protein
MAAATIVRPSGDVDRIVTRAYQDILNDRGKGP